jgi:crotonobetainyl-CoA:carnitine CoA-transferase CaiB-like acyl-CoA transferase
MSGLMSVTGEGPGRAPVKVGPPVSDITAGILAAMGISAAYAHKLKTGQGQRVDTSLFEAAITHTYWQSAICFATGESPGPMGSAHPLNAPYQALATRDGWVNLGAANEKNWERLLDLIGAKHLNQDKRFSTNRARMQNREQLVVVLEGYFTARDTDYWVRVLNEAGIPAGPILSIGEMHRDPQVIAREMVTKVHHPVAGEVKTIGAPVKFYGSPGGVKHAAPVLGQHTVEVLREVGYSDSEIHKLSANGIISIANIDEHWLHDPD